MAVITLGNRGNVKFWTSPWLDSLRPKYIAPKTSKDEKGRIAQFG
jgi:hypothetical protein